MKEILKFQLLAGFFLATAVCLGQVRSYDDFQANDNGVTDQETFNEAYTNNYEQWDLNRDGAIDDREFYESTFNRLDQNMDGTLIEEEWQEGYDHLYGDHISDLSYSTFDTDLDGRISTEEFYSRFKESNYYTSFDADRDGVITSEELNDGVFSSWDRNADGRLDREEYNQYSNFYIDQH